MQFVKKAKLFGYPGDIFSVVIYESQAALKGFFLFGECEIVKKVVNLPSLG